MRKTSFTDTSAAFEAREHWHATKSMNASIIQAREAGAVIGNLNPANMDSTSVSANIAAQGGDHEIS